MDEPPSTTYRPRRLAAVCGAALAAALFTPIPASTAQADNAAPVRVSTVQTVSTVHTVAASTEADEVDQLAQSLISTGLIGVGLALGGLVIVTHRRRQW